ncbi:TIGR03808 family TAT-translocated repetitive protein [Devosia epidermidihirudinis]|uniref:TIGR03808 family TAT-translocated repetitive protein n=1 Tax=Devosia epidermidihirudinis TaxID=1293439 RepID=UPI00069641FD|nr:TIGR03808 family TAT-translocated repetitive protein [Devosia epidermidihirudinis]
MTQTMLSNRRRVLAGIATLAIVAPAAAQSQFDAASLGIVADSGKDLTTALQRALDSTAATGQTLRLPAGRLVAANLVFPSNLIVEGVPGRTELIAASGGFIGKIAGASDIVLRDIAFLGASDAGDDALLSIDASDAITLERCSCSRGSTGLSISESAATIRDCRFTDLADAAIHSMNSRGLVIAGNRIERCGNAGIRVWRSANGADGSIITGNHIAKIDWAKGGNGQNGNGINVFRADEVIIANNHIADCAFTAVRLNSTNNTQISGNTCLRSGEVGIFSEFAFSGSIIANNIVDGAAGGISMTNFDSGGQLAVCTGNIVRNIMPTSPVNPDSTPYGIFAEADAAITGNTVQKVPGTGIGAGAGPYLRNVIIASNVISTTVIGVAVSVVDGAGKVHIADNLISDSGIAIAGMAWRDVVEPDLATNAARYPNVTVGN